MKTKSSKAVLKRVVLFFLLLLLIAAIAFGTVYLIHRNRIQNTTDVATIVTEEDLSQLDQYPNLVQADLRGSRCYDAIINYADTHPAVTVLYSVSVDGEEIENTAESVDWSGSSLSALTDSGRWLPNLKAINLGETSASAEELNALRAAYPQAELTYTVSCYGKTWSCSDTEADFSFCRTSDSTALAELLTKLPALRQVTLPDSERFSTAGYVELYSVRPDISYNYHFSLWGQDFTTADSEMKFRKNSIGNESFEEMWDLLHSLPSLTYLSFDRCDIDDSYMVELRETLPTVKVAWRIYFWQFSVMTDTERIWAIGGLTDEYTECLKYCTDVRYLDLGHNELHDISFLACMPKLEVCILSMSPIDDISVLVNCPELEYLELTISQVTDLTPLLSCPKLKNLELSQCYYLKDITPLYEIDLDRFHMMYNYNAVPQEQIDTFVELHPNCCVDFSNAGICDPYFTSDWRYMDDGSGFAPRYAKLREQIGYDDPLNESYLYEWLETD